MADAGAVADAGTAMFECPFCPWPVHLRISVRTVAPGRVGVDEDAVGLALAAHGRQHAEPDED